MSSLMIRDLSGTRELDRRAMSGIAGGTGSNVPMPSGLGGLGSLAGLANVNVNVNVIQNLDQKQIVNVAALNDIGSIGPGVVLPLKLRVDPILSGANYSAV
ncbi:MULTISPECIES: hypothetical protein [unclassified Paraburkholderia]|uniref:hypothetical protein n=1 Tax=unclassified Paraburkholderia TaxID=2615204 RepID=UPI00162237EA|nr:MULTISPECIES: hypothetical protein [unclassified Paraburkholderia]MBC8731638.1 hypothetical protein [Paraburkholderia sp. UCT2]